MAPRRAPRRSPRKGAGNGSAATEESPSKSPTVGELRSPSHGNGKILHGSLAGTHRGGSGRPPNELKELLRENLGELIPVLHQRMMGQMLGADGQLATTDEMLLRYFGELQRKALPSEKEIGIVDADMIRSKLRDTRAAIVSDLGTERAKPLLATLQEIWDRE